MGTTGTIMGCSRFFKEKNPEIQVIGCQPEEGSQIPGIRKWPEAYLPKIFERARVDRVIEVSQGDAEEMTRAPGARGGHLRRHLLRRRGCRRAAPVAGSCRNAVIVTVICDRGDRYLSTGVFPGLMTPVLVFDIETVPDCAGIRKLYDLPADLPDDDVAEIAFQKRRAQAAAATSCRCTCSA